MSRGLKILRTASCWVWGARCVNLPTLAASSSHHVTYAMPGFPGWLHSSTKAKNSLNQAAQSKLFTSMPSSLIPNSLIASGLPFSRQKSRFHCRPRK